MRESMSLKLTRRSFLLSVAAPLLEIGVITGRPPAWPSPQPEKKILKGSDLGLTPDPRRDQTAAFDKALKEAAEKNAWIQLDIGDYVLGNLEVSVPVRLLTVGGTNFRCRRSARFLMHVESDVCSIERINFNGQEEGYEDQALLDIAGCSRLNISSCNFNNFMGTGLSLFKCQGTVNGNRFDNLSEAAIFSENANKLRISNNIIRKCQNNGILVWQSQKRPDGSIIENNDIQDINNRSGGDGPFGNGINIFRAGQVTVRNNQIRRCAYSAIRNNSGDDCRITDNICEDLDEVAIFVEFNWRRALVRGNRIRRASAGISATNMDHGGGGGVIEQNTIEDIRPRIVSPDVLGYGISAEADTMIRENTVRRTSDCGITLGWGPYMRNVTATKNHIEDCTYGIGVSVTEGAGRASITYNEIIRPVRGAIVGFDHENPVTGDFLRGARPPRHILLRGNKLKA